MNLEQQEQQSGIWNNNQYSSDSYYSHPRFQSREEGASERTCKLQENSTAMGGVAAKGRLDGDGDRERRVMWCTTGGRSHTTGRVVGREEPHAWGCRNSRLTVAEGQGLVDPSVDWGRQGSDPTLLNLFAFGSTCSEPDAQIRSGSCLRTGRPAPLAV
jgi:hypothetical protein